ncbi:MAG: kelch repeat-containing protein [Bacteroidota bacterium]
MSDIGPYLLVLFTINLWFSTDAQPCSRSQPVIAYRTGDNSIMMFGGYCNLEKRRMNDLWKFDGQDWTLIAVEKAPQARSGHSMVFDSFKNRLVLFGGKNEDGILLNDVWVWNGIHWKQLEGGEPSPKPRQSHRMVFDSNTRDVFLFGGSDSSGQSLNDTWILRDNKWIKMNSTDIPPPRLQHTMAYDAQRKKVVLFGGFTRTEEGKIIFGDTWEWQESKGWQLKNENALLARDHHAIAYDNNLNRTIIFGGYNQGYLGDTWSWNGEEWSLLSEEGPSARAGKPGMVYSSSNKRLILFGGWDKSNAPLMDFWNFNGADKEWSMHNTSRE